jgi:peptidoglycan/xylan/chitin deacetylase (PgdA/CDA1 family)
MPNTFYFFKKSLLITLFAAVAACNSGKDKTSNADSTKKDSLAAQSNTGPGSTIKLDSSKRYIYLTWDDAPQPPGTSVCKNIFHQQGVKATFFVVGFNDVGPLRNRILDSLRNGYPEILIANHSFTHGFKNNYKKFYQLPDSAIQDFLKNQQALNVPVKIIRLPGNNSWVGKGVMRGPKSTMTVCKKLDSLGYKVIGWDIEWQFKKGDIPIQGADEMVKKVNTIFDEGITNEQNAVVILAHDRMFKTPQYADSLVKFISVLKQDPRNVFETVDHYPMVMRK